MKDTSVSAGEEVDEADPRAEGKVVFRKLPPGENEGSIHVKQSEGGKSGESKEGVGFEKISHGGKLGDIFDKRIDGNKADDITFDKQFVEEEVVDDTTEKREGREEVGRR